MMKALTNAILSMLFVFPTNEVAIKGVYSNFDYGFAVKLPENLTGFRPDAPAPNHGFGLDLSKRPKSYVWVDASYNSLDWDGLNDAMNFHIGALKDEKNKGVVLLKKEQVPLSTLKAVRFTIKYKAVTTNEDRIDELIVAFRNLRKSDPIVYTIGLTTSADHYERDRNVISQLQQNWVLKKLP